MINKLIAFDNPDQEFIVLESPSSTSEYDLLDGDEVLYEADIMSDDQIMEWAEEGGYLDEKYGYIKDNGDIDIDSLRDLIREEEETNCSRTATPSGRALFWFQNLGFVILIDGYAPGNDWQGVIAKNRDALVKVQKFLFENGIKVNFILKNEE